MELSTFSYFQNSGWSVDSFPPLDSPTTLVIIFSAPEYLKNQQPINQLLAAYPSSITLGCSTAGEIFEESIFDASISVGVVKFKETGIRSTQVEIKSSDQSFETGKELAERLNQNDLRGLFVLSDGLNINGSELVRGMNSVLHQDVIVTGGLAGDGSHFKNTWVIYNHSFQGKCAVAVGFYGDAIRIGHGSGSGWNSFGPERHITKSERNILYELDGKPALTLYKEYLGNRACELPASGLLFPMAIRKNMEDKKEIIRTILSVDEKTQSLTFAGNIPQGWLVKLMRANFDRLIDSANQAAIHAKKTGGEPDSANTLAITISCVGRRLVLGAYTEEEIESTLKNLPQGTKQIGFYSYGEISPYETGFCDLHNQTITLITFFEKLEG